MEIEGWGEKKTVLIIKGSVCAIGREPPKIPRQGCTRPHFFSPHTLPTLFPSGPVGLRIPERVECGSQMALPLALCLSTPLCTPWWNSDQPNYHCCLQQLFLDRADIPYYKKKKKKQEESKKTLEKPPIFQSLAMSVSVSCQRVWTWPGRERQPSVPSE